MNEIRWSTWYKWMLPNGLLAVGVILVSLCCYMNGYISINNSFTYRDLFLEASILGNISGLVIGVLQWTLSIRKLLATLSLGWLWWMLASCIIWSIGSVGGTFFGLEVVKTFDRGEGSVLIIVALMIFSLPITVLSIGLILQGIVIAFFLRYSKL